MHRLVVDQDNRKELTHILYFVVNGEVHISRVTETAGNAIVKNCSNKYTKYYLEPMINPYKDKIRQLLSVMWSDRTQPTTENKHFFCRKCNRSFVLDVDVNEWECPCCGSRLHSQSYGENCLTEALTALDLPHSHPRELDDYTKRMLLNDLANLKFA